MKNPSHPLGGRLLKIIAYSCFVVSVLAACSSDVTSTNPSESTAKLVPAIETELSTGISADTLSANFGQSQSAEKVAAMRTEVNSFFAKQRSNTVSVEQMQTTTVVVNAEALQLTGVLKPVYRFFNTNTGTHFFTISEVEKNVVQGLPNFSFEGPKFAAMQSAQPGLVPIYRFYNKVKGVHFFTVSAAEKDSVIANLSSIYNYEGESWYARATATPGWIPIYRMYNTSAGAHFYTSSAVERANILATLPQFNDEGIGYYVRPDSALVTSVSPFVANLNNPTLFTVTGSGLPLTAVLKIQDATCLPPTNISYTGFQQICTPQTSTGNKTITVQRDNTVGSTMIDDMGTVWVSGGAAAVGTQLDTGITPAQCYQSGNDSLVSCSSAAALALNDKQDGHIGRDVTDFSIGDGQLGFSYSAVPGGCVKDNVTGLTWEVKTNDGGLRDMWHAYTNYDNLASPQFYDGFSYINPTQVQIDAGTNSVGFVNEVNAASLCGYTDWRLPTSQELQGIVDFGRPTPGYVIESGWFPNTWGTSFWSSTAYGSLAENALRVGFYEANISGSRNRSTNQPVRLVRGAAPVIPVRYTYSADGSEVMDAKTGLTWQRCSLGQTWSGSTCTGTASSLTHENALVQAKAQAIASGKGWYLPNVKELTSIQQVAESTIGTSIDLTAFPATSQSIYWTSTPVTPYVYSAWWVNFASNNNSYFNYRYNSLRVRLVRATTP